jgi:hypothetical protein
MPRVSGEPGEEGPIFESINAGKILDAVTVAELKQAWSKFQFSPQQKAAPQLSLKEQIGGSGRVPELFMRCIVLIILRDKGVDLSDAVFQEVAETPLGLEQLHTFANR